MWEVFLVSRLPRLLAILCTGVGMSVAGLIMQQLCSNKFVSPTTGATISSAQLGILLALLFMPSSTLWSRALFSFAAAILGTWVFVWFIQRIRFKDAVMVPLVGIMFGNVIGGITSYLAYQYEMTQALSSWLVGHFSLVTAGGSETVNMDTGEDFGQGRFSFPGSSSESAASEETGTDTASAKGLKADGTILIQGGTFSTDTADDSIHAGGDISITAGTFQLQSGDDAIHSDSNLLIQDGDFTIPYCYEGIEVLSITIDGGTFQITSQDDGLNAAGGADSSGFGVRQQDRFASSASSDSFILINGGTFTITSQGDCIDSKTDLTINGGTLDLTCNGSGNTALDTDGSYTNNGGTVTTNDGSEENPGAMGGGQGGMGGKMGGGRQSSAAPPSSTAP